MAAPERRRRVLLASSSADERAPYDDAATAIDIELTTDPTASVDGVVAIDAASARVAAAVAERLGRSWHPRAAVETSADPLLSRGRLMAAGLPVPWFFTMPIDGTLASVADRVRFPCVVKPAAGRGAIRVDDPASFEAALARLTAAPSARTDEGLIVEGYVPGWELLLQGVLTEGALHVLALLASPDAPRTRDAERVTASAVAHVAAALGLRHGPIHAVCRVNDGGVFLVTLAPWAIAARLARVLRFATMEGAARPRFGLTLAEILLRHAVGESLDDYGREA